MFWQVGLVCVYVYILYHPSSLGGGFVLLWHYSIHALLSIASLLRQTLRLWVYYYLPYQSSYLITITSTYSLTPSLPLITSQSDSVLVKCSTGEYKTPNHPISSQNNFTFFSLDNVYRFYDRASEKERGTNSVLMQQDL